MLLATLVLLCPFPQIGDEVAKAVAGRSAAVTTEIASTESTSSEVTAPETTKESSLSQPLPSMPEAKVKTDAEVAANMAAPEAIGPHVGELPMVPMKAVKVRPYEGQGERKMWWALAAVGHSAAIFDAWSTRRAISQGYGTEGNPMLRPFAHSGMLYAATQVSPAVMDFVGKRMMVSQHGWVRHMWWLPQAAGAGFSIGAGVHNVGLVP